MHGTTYLRCLRAVLTLSLLFWGSAASLHSQSIRLIQGGNSWDIRALHDVVAYDLQESTTDPQGLAGTLSDMDSPVDPGPGTLSDGLLRFYKLDERGQDVASFYGYSSAFPSSASSSLARQDTARVFLHLDDTSLAMALVIVLDAPNDGGGGQADISVSGLPAGAFWSVEDDPGEGFAFDPATGIATASWNWLDCCTDGGAISGLEGQDLTLDVGFVWRFANNGTITALQFLTGTGASIDDFTPINLDPNQPFTLEIVSNGLPVAFESSLRVLKNVNLDTPRLAWRDLNRVSPTVDPASPVRVFPGCILADGITPGRVVLEPRGSLGALLGPGMEVTVDESGIGNGASAGPLSDLNAGYYSQEVVSSRAGTGFLGYSVEGQILSSVATLLYVDSLPQATIQLQSPGPFRVDDLVCFQAQLAGGRGPYTYSWDFDGDGQEDASSRNTCFRFTEPGEQSVRLDVEDGQPCKDRDLFLLEILP